MGQFGPELLAMFHLNENSYYSDAELFNMACLGCLTIIISLVYCCHQLCKCHVVCSIRSTVNVPLLLPIYMELPYLFYISIRKTIRNTERDRWSYHLHLNQLTELELSRAQTTGVLTAFEINLHHAHKENLHRCSSL